MQISQIVTHSGNFTMRSTYYFLLYFLIFPLFAPAQNSKATCGVYHKPSNSLTANQPQDVVDQFGNGYTFEELNIRSLRDQYASNGEGRNASNCSGGDFTLEFIGLTCDEEITICNVFQELSDLIDIGVNGSSPLITVVKESFQNDNGTDDNTTLGVGITFFQPDCGIANNLIFDVMYTDITLAAGFSAGVLRINSNLPFYNDVQGPVAGAYDMHTMALHEALHILGYSSQIADGGGTVQGFYSRWDTFLYSNNDQDSLIVGDDNAPLGCCDAKVFNPLLSYNQVITADCNMDIYFRNESGQNIARTYGTNYPATNPGGLLSHLDRCDEPGDTYVMRAELAPLEEKDITQEEIDILLALGYQTDGGAAECNVIANDDFVLFTNPNFGSFLPYADIFDNDALPDDFNPQTDVIFHTSGCGTIDDFTNTTIFEQTFGLLINFSPCVTFDLCYTLIGCEGECDDGVITLEKLCPPCYPRLSDCPPADICAGEELFCYGDFDQFIPKSSSGEPVFELEAPHCPNLIGSPDIYYNQNNGNRVVGMFNTEGIIIPLSTPVQPGCTINISCRASGTEPSTLLVYGSAISPCESNQTPTCPSNNQSDFQCIGTDAIVDGNVFAGGNGNLACDNTTPSDIDCACTENIPLYNEPTEWSNITLAPFVNNSDEAIAFLLIRTTAVYALFDDLVITADCDNEAIISADSQVEVCQGQEATVEVIVCIEGTNTTPNDVILTANPPDLLGTNITPGSAFADGFAIIPNTIAGPIGNPNCYTVDFNLQVGYNIPVGTQMEVSFDAVIANACPDPISVTDAIIDVIACDPPCVLESDVTITASCGNDGAIEVTVTGGSGNYTYQWSGGLGNTPSVSGLAPGNYEFVATDVSDPDCFVKGEFVVPLGDNCGTGCEGDGTIEIAHKVVQIFCLESEPGFDRYYIDMYIPNWGGTQTENFELCSEDIFVTTPNVILESNESFLIQSFSALNIFMIIQVPSGTFIDQGICFETPVCIDGGQVCGAFCVTDFPNCPEEGCDFDIVPDISFSPTGTSCGNLTGNDLYFGNVGIQIQGVSGVNLDYVQFVLVTGNGDPNFWQENNVPQVGGVATLADQAMCWKAYDSQYFCFKITIGYSIGDSRLVCEKNICLNVDDLLGGDTDGGGEEEDERGGRRTLDFQEGQNAPAVFKVYPNPVGQQLRVQNTQQASVQLQLISLQGRVLTQQSLAAYDQAKLSVSNYPSGVYLLRIRDAASGAILQMDKIIIAH